MDTTDAELKSRTWWQYVPGSLYRGERAGIGKSTFTSNILKITYKNFIRLW
jgi:hypothetical protein